MTEKQKLVVAVKVSLSDNPRHIENANKVEDALEDAEHIRNPNGPPTKSSSHSGAQHKDHVSSNVGGGVSLGGGQKVQNWHLRRADTILTLVFLGPWEPETQQTGAKGHGAGFMGPSL